MVEILGYKFPDYMVAEYKRVPKLIVEKTVIEGWGGKRCYYTLLPKYCRNQLSYVSLLRSNEHSYYDKDDLQNDKNDLQDMANEFNNNKSLNKVYKQSRMIAVNNLINDYTKDIKEYQEKLDKIKKLKAELDEAD